MKKLLVYMKDYKKESILGPLFKLLEASFELLVPLVVSAIIDVGIANRDVPYIVCMVLLMVALGVIIQQLLTGTMMRTSISARMPEPSAAMAATTKETRPTSMASNAQPMPEATRSLRCALLKGSRSRRSLRVSCAGCAEVVVLTSFPFW